jgi:hypothetical protein
MLEKLKIAGYSYDKDCVSKVETFYYIEDETFGDNFIGIFKSSNMSDIYVILYYFDGETVQVETFYGKGKSEEEFIKELSSQINSTLENLKK